MIESDGRDRYEAFRVLRSVDKREAGGEKRRKESDGEGARGWPYVVGRAGIVPWGRLLTRLHPQAITSHFTPPPPPSNHFHLFPLPPIHPPSGIFERLKPFLPHFSLPFSFTLLTKNPMALFSPSFLNSHSQPSSLSLIMNRTRR